MQALLLGSNEADCAAHVERLRRAGYDTLIAGSAAHLGMLLDGGTPDLLLLDFTLPNGDGLRVCEEIRARFGDGPVIIFLGTRNTARQRAVGIELGADDFLDVTCDGDELIARLDARMRRRAFLAGPLPPTIH